MGPWKNGVGTLVVASGGWTTSTPPGVKRVDLNKNGALSSNITIASSVTNTIWRAAEKEKPRKS